MSKPQRSMTAIRKQEEIKDLEEKGRMIVKWMEEKLGEELPKNKTFREIVFDGVVFCRIANALKPGSVKKFHRKPRLLMMQLENIAFFLAVCKTRFGISEQSLFTPTDVQDESEEANVNTLRKMLSVMIQIRAAFPGSDQEELVLEPETEEPTDEVEPEPEPEPVITSPQPAAPTSVATESVAQPVVFVREPKNGWYLRGQPVPESPHIEEEIVGEITQVIHEQLSIESKRELINELRDNLQLFYNQLGSASVEDLRKSMAHEGGLGDSLNDVPLNKERQWYLTWILQFAHMG
eukprot:TRINITY_DN10402_c0_g1_i5.p1 TRINITY_DN10402_c0_g1~~TRINITY_DN10402_c0_g1_i5.p1  ORF type:complete len:293 (-),score=49.16 TRINITY_DN10402_c0_g1_i5:92-970(-)